jgi:hypothetical protein
MLLSGLAEIQAEALDEPIREVLRTKKNPLLYFVYVEPFDAFYFAAWK